MPSADAGGRSCLHCALERALRAERAPLEASGLEVEVLSSGGALLPVRAGRMYRELRQLLREVRGRAHPGQLRLVVLGGVAGKSYVEVTATFRTANGWHVESRTFSRYVLGALWPGFAELSETP